MNPLYEVRPLPIPSPATLPDAIAFYTKLGFAVTAVARGAKSGYIKGWSQPNHAATAADFRALDNIALLNGVEHSNGKFNADVDLDANSNEARLIARRLLPPTGWKYGRASKPESHACYLVNCQLETRRHLGIDGKVIIELRGITKKKTHTLSVAPGSTHESGEAIRFCEPRGEIGWVDDGNVLVIAVQHIAVGIVIASAWPASNRHNLRLAYAKVLHECGLSVEQIVALLEAVMEATGSDVADVRGAVLGTVAAGAGAKGASGVIEALGDDTGKAVLKALRKILGQRDHAEDDEGSDGIVMRGGSLSQIVDQAEAALVASGQIYQRGGMLTRVIKLDAAVGDVTSVRREVGSTVLAAIREPWLLEQMSRALPWYAVMKDGRKRADPNPLYARTLASRGEWRFPVLRGIKTSPTLARDGRIIEKPGFDSATGLLLDFEPNAFPPVPAAPTVDDARAALESLKHPLRGFPFVDDADDSKALVNASASVALSAVLTALVRCSLRTSPLHGFDAPAAGTGKSMLAEIPGLIATGFRPPALSQGKSEEEDEKRLSTVLFAGDPVIHLDNCERALSGEFLCSMLTQEVLQARILGQSERRILASTALVVASGNNLTFAGDTSRRVVVCRLDAKVERPDSRRFDFDCQAEVLSTRPELVVAGLTILLAYHLSGRPSKLVPMGSFTDWEWVRGALVWLGCADPADTRLAILDNDPRKDDLVSVMHLWETAFGSEPIDVSAISNVTGNHAAVDLEQKFIEIACRQGKWNSKSVGWWLKRNKDRVVSSRAFRSLKVSYGQQWYLEGAAAAAPTTTPVEEPPF